MDKKHVLLMTSAAPSQSPFSTTEKRPPIGLGFLISVLRNAGHEVFFIDNYLQPSNFLETNYLQRNNIDYVGIYANTICYRDTLRMFYKLDYLRRTGQWKGKIIVGGPHTTVALDTIPDFVDYVVQGEGEQAILNIVEDKAKERVVRFPPLKNLDELPMPAWDYFIHLPYKWSVDWFDEMPVFTMNTSRGCPFQCTFCSVGSIWGKQYTYFSAERIVSDIEYLIKLYGIKGIYFREDNFTLNRQRLIKFCNLLLEKGINIHWACETRVNTLDREIVELMHRAGSRAFYFGVESGSQRILDFLKKGITVEQIRNAFKLCNEFGIKTAASVIVGVPTETENDIEQTIKLVEEIKPTVTWHNVFVGIPDSGLYQYVKKNKLYEFIDDRGLLYLKGHNERAKKFYGTAWNACIPFDKNNPKTSVIMSIYNGFRYLEDAIKSILSQTYQNFEFIIINDASTDNTHEILDKLDDPRIKIITNSENIGLTRSLNKGIAIAKGVYIARMDADDISHPLRFEKQVDYMEKNNDCLVLGTWIGFINEEGCKYDVWKTPTNSEKTKKELPVSNTIGHGSAMIRKSALKKVNGYNEKFIYAQDYDLWLRLSEIGKLSNLPEELYYLRFWPNSISVSKKKLQDKYALLARQDALQRRNQNDREIGNNKILSITSLRNNQSFNPPKISVILPTYNRHKILVECLEGFSNQTISKEDFEVVVVDDGSQPPVKNVINEFSGRLNIIYHYQENSGLAVARNACIERAKASLLALHDDDDVPAPDYLERCLKFHEQHPDEEDILLAQVVPHPDLESTPILAWMFNGANGIIGFPDPKFVHDFWWFFGGTSSCKKSIFRFGMFDPEYKFGFEDTELAIRLNTYLSLRVHYDPKTLSYLLRAPSFSWIFKRSYREGRSHHRVFNRHGDIILVGIGKDALSSEIIVTSIQVRLREILINIKKMEDMLNDERNTFLSEGDKTKLKEELNNCYYICRKYSRAKGWIDFEKKVDEANGLYFIEELLNQYYSSSVITSKINLKNEKGLSNQNALGNKSLPLVSVVVTCYNYGHFLPEALKSIISQTFDNFEIIIVNDGSADNTIEIAEKFIRENPKQCIQLINQENSGQPAISRNRGISEATGKYILCLDADDKIEPAMIEECVKLLENHPEVSIAYTDQIYFDDKSSRKVQVYDYDFSHLIQSNFMGYCSLFRRKAWEVSVGFPADVGYEDWDFWITCGEKGHFGKRIPKHLFCYRTHKEGRYQKDLKKDAEIKAHIVMKHPMLYDERTKEWAKKIIELSNKIENVLKKRFKIIAIISAHNEGDIIYQVIGDLIKQGVEVYFINHCSTDNTVEEASKWLGKGLIHIENFPQDANYPEQNKQEYIWSHILKRKQELAAILDADWFIHHDADEFRESPWPGLSLFEAIYVVDRSGYNAIDFELLNFRPTDNSFVSGADVRDAFKYYELSEDFNKLQIKAWKKQKQPVDLATTGGHDVQFEGKKVYPIKFILRHYPVRSQTHGMQKVFQERKSRFNRQERGWGWHVQYNKVTDEQYNFLYNPSSLKLYNESDIRLLLLSQQAYAIKQQLLKESGLSNHNMPGEFFTNADDLFHCGEYNEAIDAYKKALETNPYPNQQLQPKEVSRLFDAYYNLALSYVNTHRLDDAITTFQKAVELHSGDATIYNNLGVLYFKKKSYNNARSFFEKALSLDNHYGEARQNLEKASHALKNCSDVTPGNPDDNKVFTDSPVVSHLRDDSETTKCLFEQNEKFNLAVSIIIPVFNKVEYTKKCIEAIKLNTPHDLLYETIIVDNASTDGTQDFLKSLRPDVKAITNKENLGFARACNQGASAARGRLLCFLNNDTSPTTGWLQALIDAANKPSVGVVGAKLLYPDGRIQHAGIEFINGIPDHPYRYAHRDAQEVNRYREMDMVTGACLVISKELFYTLAGFDEIYRNGVEDIDLCVRIRLAGFKVAYEPKAVIFHYEGQSAGRFNHVRENLQIFFNRWKNRFGINGQLKIPESVNIIISEMSLLKEQTHVACRWEGSQFVYHSLALINRELCLQLMDSGYEISIIPYEPDQFGADADPRFKEISQHINKPLTGKADIHVRHQWPPNLTPPLEGHWVIIQPWEFGSLPEEWVRVFSTQVDEMWAPSNYVRQVYIDSGVPAERVVVIPNGINPEKFHPEVKPYQLETQKKFKFLFVGGTIYRKGIDLLLQAYLDTFRRSDDVCLVIKDMGGNSFYAGQTFKKEIERIQQNKELPEVEYIEQTLSEAELVGLYTASDVLAHPYRGEGFGLPILEAMACGIPAIVTNGGACLDFCNSKNSLPVKATKKLLQEKLIGDRKTVDYPWMFEVEIEDLKKKMRYAYENPEEMNALGKEISSNVRKNWTWERSAQKIKERIEFLRKLPILRYTKDNSSDHTLDVSRESELFNMANVGCVERSETQQIP